MREKMKPKKEEEKRQKEILKSVIHGDRVGGECVEKQQGGDSAIESENESESEGGRL